MQIEKKVHLKASQSRVWKAIADAQQFGAWFGMKLDGAFAAGKHMRGEIVPTKVDAEVAKMQEPYTGMTCELWVEKVEPEKLFSFRWHPFAIEKDVDYSNEPTTLVSFVLTPAEGGVLLTITESGFENVPLERRAKAFAANEGGWAKQCELIEKFLVQTA